MTDRVEEGGGGMQVTLGDSNRRNAFFFLTSFSPRRSGPAGACRGLGMCEFPLFRGGGLGNQYKPAGREATLALNAIVPAL